MKYEVKWFGSASEPNGESSTDDASVIVSALVMLVSLSSLECDVVDEVDMLRISIGEVPAIDVAFKTCILDVDISAVGDDICVRETGLPAR